MIQKGRLETRKALTKRDPERGGGFDSFDLPASPATQFAGCVTKLELAVYAATQHKPYVGDIRRRVSQERAREDEPGAAGQAGLVHSE